MRLALEGLVANEGRAARGAFEAFAGLRGPGEERDKLSLRAGTIHLAHRADLDQRVEKLAGRLDSAGKGRKPSAILAVLLAAVLG